MGRIKINYLSNNNYYYIFNFTQEIQEMAILRKLPHVKITIRERVNRNRKTVPEFHRRQTVLFNLITRLGSSPQGPFHVFNIPFVEDAADETPAGCAIPVRFARREKNNWQANRGKDTTKNDHCSSLKSFLHR